MLLAPWPAAASWRHPRVGGVSGRKAEVQPPAQLQLRNTSVVGAALSGSCVVNMSGLRAASLLLSALLFLCAAFCSTHAQTPTPAPGKSFIKTQQTKTRKKKWNLVVATVLFSSEQSQIRRLSHDGIFTQSNHLKSCWWFAQLWTQTLPSFFLVTAENFSLFFFYCFVLSTIVQQL